MSVMDAAHRVGDGDVESVKEGLARTDCEARCWWKTGREREEQWGEEVSSPWIERAHSGAASEPGGNCTMPRPRSLSSRVSTNILSPS